MKISLIICVYNREKYLKGCLDSLLDQTYQDFEIIIVNDGSTDNSQQIIEEYATKDSRIRFVEHSENRGLFEARRTGVFEAKGKYCMQIDSDDTLEQGSLSSLITLIDQKSPDLIQFRMTKIPVNEELPYYTEPLFGADVFQKIFVTNTFFSWNLCAKCILTDLLKKAYGEIPEIYVINSEDFLLYYVIAYFATHYEYCEKAQYLYLIHDNNSISLNFNEPHVFDKWLENYRQVFWVLDSFKQKYQIAKQYPVVNVELLHDLDINRFMMMHIPIWKQREYFIRWCKTIGVERVFDILHKCFSFETLLKLLPLKLPKTPRPIKNIAVIIDHLGVGGVERVSMLLCQQLVKQGYNIHLFVDSLEEKYMDIPEGVNVEISPSENFFKFMEQKIQEYQIDLIHVQVHGKPRNLLLLLYAQFKNILSICSVHGNALWMIYVNVSAVLYHNFYSVADVVTVLSEFDQQFLQSKTDTPHIYIPNLLTFDPNTCSNSVMDSNHLLYLGRFSFEKRPEFLIRAFKKVVQEIPTAKLTMVGDGPTFSQCQQLIKELNLTQHIILEGFQRDVFPYLEKTSLLVVPSLTEGFSLATTEAMSCGVPILMSYLPYNELCYCNGVVTFDKSSELDLSEQIITLLKDRAHLQNLGAQAKESSRQFNAEKTMNRWEQLLNELSQLNFTDELLAVKKKISLNELNSIFNQEYYQAYFKNIGIFLPINIDYPRHVSIVDPQNNVLVLVKKILRKLMPIDSIQYRLLRKILLIVSRFIQKINVFFNIQY